MMHDVVQVGEQINGFVQTEAFESIFGANEDVLGADPEGVVHAANRLMDLYERYLQLAQRVRGVSAPPRFTNALDTCARLVDEPLAGMEEFIADYVAIVETLPERLIGAEGQDIVLPVTVRIHVDNELLEDLVRQVKDLGVGDD
jgi:hypothetical protein